MSSQLLPLGLNRRGKPSGWKSTQVAAPAGLFASVKLEPVAMVAEEPPGSSGAADPSA